MAGCIADAEKLREAFLNTLLAMKVNVSDDKEQKKERDNKLNEREKNLIIEEKEREREREREKERESQKRILPPPQQSIKKQKFDSNINLKSENNDYNDDASNSSEIKSGGIKLNSKLNVPQSVSSSITNTASSSTGVSTGASVPNPAIIDRKVAKYCRDMTKELLQQVCTTIPFFVVLTCSGSEMYITVLFYFVLFCPIIFCTALYCCILSMRFNCVILISTITCAH